MTDTARMASAYGAQAQTCADVLDASLRPAHQRVVGLAGVGPGVRVLDLATGTGAIARLAAASGGDVVGVDLSPGMVEVARKRSGPELRFDIADAAELLYPAASFDVVTCGFGLTHLPDLPRALAEVRRCLTPGGLLVVASWGDDGANAAFSGVLSTLRHYAQHGLHTFVLDEHTWADASLGHLALTDGGFGEVSTTTERLEGEYDSAQAAVDWTLAWPDHGETFDTLSPPDQRRLRTAAIKAVAALHDLRWWFAINYHRAKVLDVDPPPV